MSQDSWENIAVLGALAVVVGVALEGADWLSKFKKRNRNESILVKEPGWTLAVEFFSIILVVLGLCVEIFATYKASGKAHDKIKDLTSELRVASDNAAAASKDAGDSKVIAARIGTTNAQLSLTVELMHSNNLVLEKQVVELERQNAPRLFRDQIGASKRLSIFAGVSALIIPGSGPDCPETAAQISRTLELAGWKPSLAPVSNMPMECGVRVGVARSVLPFNSDPSDPRSGPASDVLISELNQCGIDACNRNMYGEGYPVGSVIITVGPTPSADELAIMKQENILWTSELGSKESRQAFDRMADLWRKRLGTNHFELQYRLNSNTVQHISY